MNIRLQKYKKNRLLGMNKYNAAIAAGYAENTAKVKGKELDGRANIYNILERRGLTDNVLADKLLQLVDAYEFIEIRNEKGELVKVRIDGNDMAKPNWTARSKGLDLAFKLKGHLSDRLDLNINKTERLLVVRYDGNKTKEMAGQVRIQQDEVPGPMERVGNGQDTRPHLTSDAIQRADSQ